LANYEEGQSRASTCEVDFFFDDHLGEDDGAETDCTADGEGKGASGAGGGGGGGGD